MVSEVVFASKSKGQVDSEPFSGMFKFGSSSDGGRYQEGRVERDTFTGVLWHYCSQCNKRFPDKTNLARHFRIHTGEKPFICSICGQAFSLKSGMQRHAFRMHNVVL